MESSLKKITLPSGWNEVSVGQFQELSSLEETNGLHRIVDIISILANMDPDDVKKINASDLDPIVNALLWTNQAPKNDYKTEINIDGVDYYLMKLSSASIAENADMDSYSNDINNLHKFFAILYRPANEEYTLDKMLRRAELFQEKLMIEDVYGTIVFFLSIAIRCERIILASSSQK